eukprot:scaffold113883_cov20-Tisochrysis_lutea.AAC.1
MPMKGLSSAQGQLDLNTQTSSTKRCMFFQLKRDHCLSIAERNHACVHKPDNSCHARTHAASFNQDRTHTWVTSTHTHVVDKGRGHQVDACRHQREAAQEARG